MTDKSLLEPNESYDNQLKTAVFIDGDWFVFSTRAFSNAPSYYGLFQLLRNEFGSETPIYFFAGSVGNNTEYQNLVKILSDIGYIVEQSPGSIRGRGKGNSDTSLIARASSLPEEYERLVLISGDGDFVPLLQVAGEQGRQTILISLPNVTHHMLMKYANQFINLEKVLEQAKIFKNSVNSLSIIVSKNLFIEKGAFFQSYLFLRDLLEPAERQITIVDPYVDVYLLSTLQLCIKRVNIEIFTKKYPPDFCVMVNKLRKENRTLTIFKTEDYHDRVIQVDDSWWHSGHSLKDWGNKVSLVQQATDLEILVSLKNNVAALKETAVQICT